MDKIICAPMGPNFEVPTVTKIHHQLITNQTKINLNGQNHLCTDGTNFEVPTVTKIHHQLITNQTKMKLYLLDTCIHTPY